MGRNLTGGEPANKKRFGRVLSLALFLLADAALLLFLHPATRPALLFAFGRSLQCPYAKAKESTEYGRRRDALADRMAKASRLVETDRSGLHLWQTPKGSFWLPARDDAFLPQTLAEQEMKIYGDAGHGVQAGDVVLDCGAHVGTYTLEALAAGAKLVVAVEPAPHNLECLRRNLASEIARGRVIIYPKGVWDHDDVLTLDLSPIDSAGDSVVIAYKGGGKGPQVPLTTIDKLVEELKLERVDFIKMDIEGAEKKALLGATETLHKYRPRLAVATEHLPDDPVAIPALVLRKWPEYKMSCGPCSDRVTLIRPEVVYFRAGS